MRAGAAKLQLESCQLHAQTSAEPACALSVNPEESHAACLSTQQTCLVLTSLICIVVCVLFEPYHIALYPSGGARQMLQNAVW